MDQKIPIRPILPSDDPCLDCEAEQETGNDEFRHRFIIRFAFFSFFLIFLGLLLYEILVVSKGYFQGGPCHGLHGMEKFHRTTLNSCADSWQERAKRVLNGDKGGNERDSSEIAQNRRKCYTKNIQRNCLLMENGNICDCD